MAIQIFEYERNTVESVLQAEGGGAGITTTYQGIKWTGLTKDNKVAVGASPLATAATGDLLDFAADITDYQVYLKLRSMNTAASSGLKVNFGLRNAAGTVLFVKRVALSGNDTFECLITGDTAARYLELTIVTTLGAPLVQSWAFYFRRSALATPTVISGNDVPIPAVDIAAQTLAALNADVDIVAQTLATLAVDIVASIILDVDIVAQALALLSVDIAAQTFSPLIVQDDGGGPAADVFITGADPAYWEGYRDMCLADYDAFGPVGNEVNRQFKDR